MMQRLWISIGGGACSQLHASCSSPPKIRGRPPLPALLHLHNCTTPLHPQVAAEALEFAGERLAQVQTVQVFAQERREADAFAHLSASGYSMAERYAVFQVRTGNAGLGGAGCGSSRCSRCSTCPAVQGCFCLPDMLCTNRLVPPAPLPTLQGIVEGAGRLAVNVGTVALLGLGGLLVGGMGSDESVGWAQMN